MSADRPASKDASTWREQAMARVLSPAREKAETRLQSFFDAAHSLIHESGTDFTVQEVVERSGQSLRSFYQYFDGKYALLLALFDDSIRTTTEELRELVSTERDPLARLHRFAVEYYRMCRPASKGRQARRGSRLAMAEFSYQLLLDHPREAADAFKPLVALFEELLSDAEEAGYLRVGLPRRRTAGVMLEALMFNAFASTISGSPVQKADGDPEEELWELLFRGIAG